MYTLEQAIRESFPEATITKVNAKSVVFTTLVRGSMQSVKIALSTVEKSIGRTSMLGYTATKLSLFVNGEYWTCKEAASFNLQHTVPHFIRTLA